MTHESLDSLILRADLELEEKLGDRYARGTNFRLERHLVKHAFLRRWIESNRGLTQADVLRVLRELDAGEHAIELRAELATYVASLAKGETKAEREGTALPGMSGEGGGT